MDFLGGGGGDFRTQMTRIRLFHICCQKGAQEFNFQSLVRSHFRDGFHWYYCAVKNSSKNRSDVPCFLIFGIYPDVTFSNMAKNPGFPPNLCTEKSHILVTLMLFH